MATLLERKGICTDARERTNAYLDSHGLAPIAPTTWRDSVRPAMEREGDADRLGAGNRATWIYDADQLWRWMEYIAKRQVLISLGHEGWHTKRAYDHDDAVWLVDEGGLDGEVDHPLFEIALPTKEQKL